MLPKENKMKNKFLLLGSLLILISCDKPNIYDPDAQIKVNVDGDKYVIPLNHIVRPDTGSYASFKTNMGLSYFFWPSGNGITNKDEDPNALQYDADIIKFHWTAKNSGIEGNDMFTRVGIVDRTNRRDIGQDKFRLKAYIDNNDNSIVSYIGNVYPNSPTTIRCLMATTKDQNSVCQMEYLHPTYNNNILLEFSGKNLIDWQSINEMAINYMKKWDQE